jgi:hypothetical protein
MTKGFVIVNESFRHSRNYYRTGSLDEKVSEQVQRKNPSLPTVPAATGQHDFL